MSLQSLLQEIQGYQVKPMTREEVKTIALSVAKRFKLIAWSKRRLDLALEGIGEIVNIEILSESEWQELTLNLTKGHFSPQELTIRIPEDTYILACQGDKDSLEIILHELGHMFLMHQSYLHKATEPPTINENAEWQADTFAEIILEEMGYETKQLSLDFGRQGI